MDVQLVNSQGQNVSNPLRWLKQGIKILGTFLSGSLPSGFPPESLLQSAPNISQKGNQSRLLCTKNCCAGAPAKPQSRLQETCWRPAGLLCWESPSPCARKIRLKVWLPLVLCAFTGSYKPELLVVSHLESLSGSSIFDVGPE